MAMRPYIEPAEHGWPRRCWHAFSERLERIRRQYGLVCWLLCVLTATGIVLTDNVHGWPWNVFMLCYVVMLTLWVGMSMLLLLRAAALGARGVLSRMLARRPEPPVPRSGGAVGLPAMPWERRDGLPGSLEDNTPGGWQGN